MKKFGWVRDLPDFRDRLYAYRTIAPQEIALPRVKYNIVSPVKDQGDLGSCVFQALATAMESTQVANDYQDWRYLSPLFGYYVYREHYADINRDDGASIRQALKAIKAQGLCREGLWPYSESCWKIMPAKESFDDAQDRQIVSYHGLLYGLQDLLICLAEGYGFVCGISVYESFMDVGAAGIVPMPKPAEKLLGGHAVYIFGYDDMDKTFHGQNSWGRGWGKGGRFQIPFSYLHDPGLAADFWTVRVIKGLRSGQNGQAAYRQIPHPGE